MTSAHQVDDTIFNSEIGQLQSPPLPPPLTTIDVPRRRRRKVLKYLGSFLKHENESDWLEEMRGLLCVVATVIATMTFQPAINPPGGVMSFKSPASGKIKSYDYSVCVKVLNDNGYHEGAYICPGEAVLAVIHPHLYFVFLAFNTISFVASLSVVLLLVSGVPLNKKPILWILSAGMCITLSFLGLTFLSGVLMLTPGRIGSETEKMFKASLGAWISLLGLVGVFSTIRFVFWLYFKKRLKTTSTDSRNMDTRSLSSAS